MALPPASLDGFLAATERRALRFAQLATGDADEALDLVQDAMIALARHYAGKPSAEWPALFHRILDNRIRRWRFKQVLTRRWLGLRARPLPSEDGEAEDPLTALPDSEAARPDAHLQTGQTLTAVQAALRRLPDRQRQAFLLRHWQGLSTEDTAQAMACTTGSVKTHLSRAVASLKYQLQWQGISP